MVPALKTPLNIHPHAQLIKLRRTFYNTVHFSSELVSFIVFLPFRHDLSTVRPSSRNYLGGMSTSGSAWLCFHLFNELPRSSLSGNKGRYEMELKILGMIYIFLGKLLSIKLHGLPVHFTYEFPLSVAQISSKNMASVCFVIPALYIVFLNFVTMGYSWPISSLKMPSMYQ